MNKNRFIGLDDEDETAQAKNTKVHKNVKGSKHAAKIDDKIPQAKPVAPVVAPKTDGPRRLDKIDSTRRMHVGPVHDPSQRVFDRHDGTGRGREVPKSGEGKGNWGNVKRPYTDVPREDGAAADAAHAPAPNDNAKIEAVVEPVDTRRTYEEYQAELEKSREAAAEAQKAARKVVVPTSLKALEVKEENYYAPQKKKIEKKKDEKSKAVPKAKAAPIDLLGITSKSNRGPERFHRESQPQRVNVSEENFPKLQ